MPSSSTASTNLMSGLAAISACGVAAALYYQRNNAKTTATATGDSTSTSATVVSKFPATQAKKKIVDIQYPHYDHEQDPQGSFMQICDMLIAEIIEELPKNYELPAQETAWLQKMLTHTVKGGKMNRGLMVVESGIAIMGGAGAEQTQPLDNTTLCRLAVLGWAIEWLQAWLLVADDIMDSSVTRRGQPCWYKTLGDAWYIAINDAVTIEAFVFKIIKRHFGHDSHLLLQLFDLMMETTLQTELGQLSDTLCDVLTLPDLTPARWHHIVKYKTSFYSFYLSVALAMTVAGVTDPQAYNAARDILTEMGVYFQAQDDYLDCYATPETLGKIGTDIADKKCGWLFTKVYHELANDTQKAYLDAHYGNCQVASPEERKIKEIYTDLGCQELYLQYEQASYDKIMAFKNSAAGDTLRKAGVPWKVFEIFLAKVYQRSH